MKKIRLDELLIQRRLFATPDEALRAIIAHQVKVDDTYATSAAQRISPDADIHVTPQAQFVSRGGIKLHAALEAFQQHVEGLRCCDVGCSTGGFSDCLLQAGASQVTCIDVGYGDLAWKVRQDPRTVVFERTNIRTADPKTLGAPFDIVVADLSFIGLTQLASVFAHLVKDKGGVLICLVKPQFESERSEVEGGIVRDSDARQRAVKKVKAALQAEDFVVTGVIESPIRGAAKGNVEYLLRAQR